MLRGCFITILIAVALATSVSACPDKVYIGLYADDSHSDCSRYLNDYAPFDVWVWVMPSTSGVECLEYRLEAPPWLQLLSTEQHYLTYDPTENYDWFGDGGIVCYEYCRFQWTWVCKHTMVPLMTGLEGYITVKERLSTGKLEAVTCKLNRPVQPVEILNYLAINLPCIVGTETTSWGAIKGLFSE